MKSIKGFTLIELIVVMAIIGVLAGILVPVITNYMEESRLSTANANAKTVYSNCANYGAMCERESVASVTSVNAQKIPTVSDNEIVPNDGQNIVKFIGKSMGISENEAGYFSAKMNGLYPEDCAWAVNEETDIVGKYPNQASEAGESLTLS